MPVSEILAFYRLAVWEDIFWGRDDDWDKLLIQEISEEEAANPAALVSGYVHASTHPTCQGGEAARGVR